MASGATSRTRSSARACSRSAEKPRQAAAMAAACRLWHSAAEHRDRENREDHLRSLALHSLASRPLALALLGLAVATLPAAAQQRAAVKIAIVPSVPGGATYLALDKGY